MSVPTMLPPIKTLRDKLLDLLDRDVLVAPSAPWSPGPFDPAAIAVYVDDTMKLRALMACDLALAIALGASVTRIPAKATETCLTEGKLTPDIAKNLKEMFQTLSGLFDLPGRPHVKLYSFHAPGEPPPEEISAHLRAFGKRRDLKIEVSRYGRGLLSFVVL